MAKHTQNNSPAVADELFECVKPFCGAGAYLFQSKRKYSCEISKLCNSFLPRGNKKLPL